MATTRGYSEDCFSNDISSLPNVIGVSASNNADTRTPAGYGDCMDVLAPTDNFLATAGTLWAVSTDMSGSAGYNRSEEHTSELKSLMRISYAVFCLKKKKQYSSKKQTIEVKSESKQIN